MDCKILISKSAKNDLRLILKYISQDLDNPKAAKILMDKFDKCISQLKTTPLLYAKIDDIKLAKLGYRKVVVNNYIMIYRYNECTKTIHIMRFFFGSRDYTKYM